MEMKILMAANIMDGKCQFVHWKHNLGEMVNSVQNILNV